MLCYYAVQNERQPFFTLSQENARQPEFRRAGRTCRADSLGASDGLVERTIGQTRRANSSDELVRRWISIKILSLPLPNDPDFRTETGQKKRSRKHLALPLLNVY